MGKCAAARVLRFSIGAVTAILKSIRDCTRFLRCRYCNYLESLKLHQVLGRRITAKMKKTKYCTNHTALILLQNYRRHKNAPFFGRADYCKTVQNEKMHQFLCSEITAKMKKVKYCTNITALLLLQNHRRSETVIILNSHRTWVFEVFYLQLHLLWAFTTD